MASKKKRNHPHLIQEMAACLVILVVSAMFWHAPPAESAPKKETPRPFVFVLPHQDDELFMAGFIKRSVSTGRPVYMVVVTDGAGSAVRDMINGQDRNRDPVFDSLLGVYHNPKEEGYAPLSRQDFSAARNREFMDSAVALGVPRHRVVFMNPGHMRGARTPIYRDGRLTSEEGKKIFAWLRKHMGDGTYATVAYGHSDHVALEQGLKAAEDITEKFFFPPLPEQGQERVLLSPDERAAKDLAIAVYSDWDPSNGHFAIALHSVPDMLRDWAWDMEEYYFRQ